MSNLEDVQNSANRYFPNNQCVILQIHDWIKYPFKVQDRLMDFTTTKHERLVDMFSDSTPNPTVKKPPFVDFWLSNKEYF